MTTRYEVVLYGASGYTGKLTAWKLAERGIPFIAAGRNKARLQEEMAVLFRPVTRIGKSLEPLSPFSAASGATTLMPSAGSGSTAKSGSRLIRFWRRSAR